MYANRDYERDVFYSFNSLKLKGEKLTKMKKNQKVLHSLEELRAACGLKPAWVKTNNKQKLQSQQKKIAGTCRVCGAPLIHVAGTNVFYCSNEECKGKNREEIVETIENEDGSEQEIKKVKKEQFVRLSNNEVANIANNLD